MSMLNKEVVARVTELQKNNPKIHHRLVVARAKNELGIEPTGEEIRKLGFVNFTTYQTRVYAAACGLVEDDFFGQTPSTDMGFSVEDCDKLMDRMNGDVE